MSFKRGTTVDLYMSYMHHASLDDLDTVGARSQWVGKGNKSSFIYIDNEASNKHYICYNGTVGPFCLT